MKYLLSSLIVVLFMISNIAFSQDVPEGDPLQTLADIILNFKTMSPLVKGSAIVMFFVQLLKFDKFGSFFEKFKYKRLLVVVLGQAYGVLQMVINGSSLLNAVVVGLVTSGGAVLIYEAVKPLLPKKKL